MIHVYTGQPGAGKTLNAIASVMKDSQFKNRAVYCYGIRGLNVEGWIEIDRNQIDNWWTLPDGCVIIVDEAQDIWRARSQGKPVPESVVKLEKHRHRGIDFVLTFQDYKQIDTMVRILVTDHFHSHRAMGLNASTIYHFDGLCIDPLSKSKQALAQVKSAPFDKDIFDLYESASLHTAKPKLPIKLLIAGCILVILLGSLLYFLGNKLYSGYSNYKNKDTVETRLLESDSDSNLIVKETASVRRDVALTDDEELMRYLRQFVPRIKGDPRSAPIYDELNKPRILPKSFCIEAQVIKKGRAQCKCYTQQVTWQRAIGVDQCITFIREGYEFDYTVEAPAVNDQERRRSDDTSARAPFDLVTPTHQPIRPTRVSRGVIANPLGSQPRDF